MATPALPTTRIDCIVLAMSSEAKKSVMSVTEPRLVAGVGQPGRKSQTEGRAAARRFGEQAAPWSPSTKSSTSLVSSPSTSAARRVAPAARRLVMFRRWYKPPSICSSAIELSPMLTPMVGTARRSPDQAADRIEDVMFEIEPGLDQQAAGADGFGVFGHQRPLLREDGHGGDSSCSSTHGHRHRCPRASGAAARIARHARHHGGQWAPRRMKLQCQDVIEAVRHDRRRQPTCAAGQSAQDQAHPRCPYAKGQHPDGHRRAAARRADWSPTEPDERLQHATKQPLLAQAGGRAEQRRLLSRTRRPNNGTSNSW